MNSITKETRRESYDAILPKVKKRSRLILETLGDRQMTASEITEELVAAGKIPYFNRNYVAPRLTELKDIGVLETVGRRKAMPCDPAPVYYKAAPGGKDKIVTTRGEVVSCEIVPGAEATDAGYRPHWATCPQAGQFKRGGKHNGKG